VTDLLGRATSSPPQLGHVEAMADAHGWQNVHSNEQIAAGPSPASGDPHRSQASRISSKGQPPLPPVSRACRTSVKRLSVGSPTMGQPRFVCI